jgi:murein DD-endopeptidase MepM/ murein hydrolase activator NlpD/uncharacterized protein
MSDGIFTLGQDAWGAGALRRVLAGVLTVVAVGFSPASGWAASFDCSKARTPQERFICAQGDVSRLDREMARVYRQHVGRLSETGRRWVLGSQRSWLAFWPRLCSASTQQIVLTKDEVACAAAQYESRIADLQPASPLPGLQAYIVSRHRFIPPQEADAPAGVHRTAYPQLEPLPGQPGPAWLAALNEWLALPLPENPGPSAAADPTDAESTTDVSVNIVLATPRLVQAVETVDIYRHGGAHGLISLYYSHFLIDEGRALQPQDVFAQVDWREALAEKVLAALRKELGEELLVSTVKEVAELIDPSIWDLSDPGLEFHFNPYAVASYARGPVRVRLDADDLQGLLTDRGRALLRVPAQANASVDAVDAVDWIWPAQGEVVSTFDDVQGAQGLSIAGLPGTPIRAAADGRVVYAGSGLRGYGRLVIIKHNNTYLSAYAHNRALLVREDQVVRQGQVIAEMGSSDADRVKLHFEIRRLGKPVDPMSLLPAR